MNQILKNATLQESTIEIKEKKSFRILFFFSIFICIFAIIIYLFLKYHSHQKEKISEALTQHFSITSLYSENATDDYLATRLSADTKEDPFVIGIIKIEKINLFYPILSKTTPDSLEIAPCRFSGPMPNEIGNLCIAGHNYANGKGFGKLHSLSKKDEIDIYDLSGKKLTYTITSISQVSADDLTCTQASEEPKKEITLITCNNLLGTRVIIKAFSS